MCEFDAGAAARHYEFFAEPKVNLSRRFLVVQLESLHLAAAQLDSTAPH